MNVADSECQQIIPVMVEKCCESVVICSLFENKGYRRVSIHPDC